MDSGKEGNTLESPFPLITLALVALAYGTLEESGGVWISQPASEEAIFFTKELGIEIRWH